MRKLLFNIFKNYLSSCGIWTNLSGPRNWTGLDQLDREATFFFRSSKSLRSTFDLRIDFQIFMGEKISQAGHRFYFLRKLVRRACMLICRHLSAILRSFLSSLNFFRELAFSSFNMGIFSSSMRSSSFSAYRGRLADMTLYLNKLGAPFNTLTSTSAGKYFCSSEPSLKDLSSKSEPSSLKSTPMSKSLVGAAKPRTLPAKCGARSFAREPNRYAIFMPYFSKIFGSIFGFTMVWKKTDELAYMVYKVTRAFPRHELFGLVSRMRRSAVSVPANIAEGYAHYGNREKRRFYEIANCSLVELEYYIYFVHERLNYIDKKQYAELSEVRSEVGKC